MRYKKSGSLDGIRIRRSSGIFGKKVKLREKKLSDARNDYTWQSDPELAKLDASPALHVSFPVYVLDYTDQLHDPGLKRHLFAVETTDGRHIGNCTCYDINDTRGEVQLGIMIGDTSYWDKGYGTDAVTTLVKHIFSNTSLKRIYLKTLDWNLRAQKCFQKCGFTPYGQINRNGNNFVLMELHREQWQKQPGRSEVDR